MARRPANLISCRAVMNNVTAEHDSRQGGGAAQIFGRSRRAWVIIAALACALAGLAYVRMHLGTLHFGWPGADAFGIRLHRLEIACIVGVALAVSGVGLQTLLRNPLAEPFILGLSTGAGVGVMGQWYLAHEMGRPLGPSYYGALLGAGASLSIVYLTSRKRGMIDPLGLLLVGVVLSTINGAIILLINYTVGSAGLRDDLALWMMGNINEAVSGGTLIAVAAITAAGLALLVGLGRAMDVAGFSQAEAESIGVNMRRLRAVLFVVASVLASGAVVLIGPLAFVGLICPHLARLMLGPSHRALLIGSAICGAILVTAADSLSTVLNLTFHVGRLPLGIFTAVLGGVCFLWMLRPALGKQM